MPFDETAQAQLEERRGTNAHVLIWLRARNRDTGAEEGIGFWTGDDHQVFTIQGVDRTYFGAGAVIEVDPIKAGVNEEVIYHSVTLPPLLPEIRQALRFYDPRLARVEIHVAPLDIDTDQPFDPVRMVKGKLNEAPEDFGPEEALVRLRIASAARFGTMPLPLYRSDAQMRRRSETDAFRDYVDPAGAWIVPWGDKPPGEPAPPPEPVERRKSPNR